jgi:quercetin dioxygenase-like cupin family protein
MTIKEVLEQLQTATHPIAKVLHKGENCKVLIIGFKKGMKLKEHKAHLQSKLTVISGTVIYKQGEQESELKKFDEKDIPINITHAVEALEDSLCLLTQG